MKKVQKIIIIIYLILVAVACIYVPWRVRLPSPNSGLVVSIGYAPLWSPPAYSIMSSKFSIIDYGKIILELIALTAIFGVLFVLISEVKTIRKGIIKLIIAYLVLVVLACTCIPCKVTYVVINEHTGGGKTNWHHIRVFFFWEACVHSANSSWRRSEVFSDFRASVNSL